MGRVLAPRGPDDERMLDTPSVRLVFRRLSINDVAGGAQPFSIDDGEIVTVVNGEIYNHRELAAQQLPALALASRSDCEVVGHLYRKLGSECLTLLNGIFAIALWDRRRRTLLLARDRLGVKPLYVAQWPDGDLLFASELKALLRHPRAPRELDWRAFGSMPDEVMPFMRPGAQPVPTGVEGVNFVPAASFVEWREGRLGPPQRYWHPHGPDEQDRPPLDDPAFAAPEASIARYAELLDDSVGLQLMSDVPMGVFLSGGLDSCLIAALASRHVASLDAFTLVEPAITRTGDPAAAARLARDLGLRLHALQADGEALRRTVRLDLQALEHLVWTLDFPMFSVELLLKYELHRHLRQVRPDIKVVLLGQGADEFAGGYAALSSSTWEGYTDHEAAQFQRTLVRKEHLPEPLLQLLDPALSDARRALPPCLPSPEAMPPPCEAWQAIRFGDLCAYNLWHEDRLAAAHGTEVRVPFLDHRLVEWLCAMPRRWRPALFFNKAIERIAALNVLPAELALRPKVPLYARGTGQASSIQDLTRTWALTAFEDFRRRRRDRSEALFSISALQRLYDSILEGKDPRATTRAAHTLMHCLCIDIFHRHCRESGAPAFEPPRWPALRAPQSADVAALAPPEMPA
jgi:asparagine synthase (glutamine-hydrolysing)